MASDQRIYFDPPVTEARTYGATGDQETKDLIGKIARLIPGEILGAYGAGLAALPTFGPAGEKWVGPAWYVAGILGTAWYVGWRIGRGLVRQKHVLAYAWAFAVWAYALSGAAVLQRPIYHEGVATLLLAATSVVFAKMKFPKKERR